MALSLAACGGSSTTTTTPVDTTAADLAAAQTALATAQAELAAANTAAEAAATASAAEVAAATAAQAAAEAAQAAAEAALDAIENPAVVAKSMVLTAGSDRGAEFVGTALADTFTASTAAVLQSFDTLDGGDGNDGLNVTDIADAYDGATGVAGTFTSVENLTLSTTGKVGAAEVAASGGTAATAAVAEKVVLTFDYTTGTDVTDGGTTTITIGGVTLTTGAITIGGVDAATDNNAVADAIVAAVNAVYPGTVAAVGGDTSAVVTITAPFGGELPEVSALHGALSGTQTANVVAVTAEAQKQVIQITASGTGDAANKTEIFVNGMSIGAVANDSSSSDVTTHATAIKNALSGYLGDSAVVTSVAGVVTVEALVAGTPLPIIEAVAAGGNSVATVAQVVANSTGVIADTGAVTEAVFDATDFTGTLDIAAGDDLVLKAAATADVTVSSTSGSVDIDGGATVNVTAVDAVDVMGNKITSATVTTGVASGDDVTIGAVSGTAADTPLLESATVTGGYDVVVTDYTSAASAKTLTEVTLSKTGNTATLDGDALTTINLGAYTASATVTLDNDATDGYALTLTAADTGIDADGNDQFVSVVADAATSIAVTSNGTDNAVKLGDNSAANVKTKSLTVDGAGNMSLDLSGAELTALKTVSAASATGNIDFVEVANAAVTLTGGAGDDSVTLDNAASYVVDMGAGADEVTAGASLGAAASVTGGEGDDTLIVGDSAHVDTAVEADKFSSFEIYRTLDDNDDAENYNLSLMSSVTKVEVGAVDDASDDVTLTDMSATQAANIHVLGDNAGFLKVDLKTDTGTADTASITIGSGLKKEEAFDIGEGITFNGIETLNLHALAGVNVTAAADKVVEIASFTSDVGTAINLTGTEFTLSNIATTKAVTIDGSQLTEGLTVDGQALATSTIIGSAKVDAMAIDAVGSTYQGNAGDDVFSALTSAIMHGSATSYTTIDGGDGDDTISTTDSNHTLVDADFTGISNVEKLVMDVDGSTNATAVTGSALFSDAFATGADIDVDAGNATVTLDFSAATVAVTIDLNSETTTNDIVVKTGSGADSVTIANVAATSAQTTVETGAGDDTIVIDLETSGTLNLGSDVLNITAGAGKDTITVTDDADTRNIDHVTYKVGAGDSTTANFDVINDYATAVTANTLAASTIDFDGGSNDHAAAVSNAAVEGYTSAELLLSSAADGLVTFAGTAAADLDVDAMVAAVQAQFTTAGDTVVFVNGDHSYVFHNDTDGDSLVQLFDVIAAGIGATDGDILVS